MKETIMLLMLLGIISTTNSYADSCDYSVDYNVNIGDQQIIFDKKGKDSIIFQGEKLIINRMSLILTNDKQTLLGRTFFFSSQSLLNINIF